MEAAKTAGVSTAALRPGRIALLAALVVVGCSGPDGEQAGICRDVVAAVDPEARTAAVQALPAQSDPDDRHGVIVRYRLGPDGNTATEHWVRCRFAGGGFAPDRGELVEVATDRKGELGDVELFMLRRFWLGRFETQAAVRNAAADAVGAGFGAVDYALQQTINALVAGSVYGLLAVAYTLVFAIISRINMAFGELAMVGAYAALVSVHASAAAISTALAGSGVGVSVVVAAALAAAIAAVYGWASERAIFRPLRKSPSQAALIATVGLAIALQEAVRLAQGARDRWLQPVLNDPIVVDVGGHVAVTVTVAKIAVVVATAALFAALLQAVRRSRLGRAWRACADDADMAALCGIDVSRTVSLTFIVSGAYAGIAGAIIALHYGGVGFTMGTMLGFKALTAAVAGGIGSLPGAMIGGLLVAGIETFWSAYLPVAARDIAVFTLLAVVLVFRPRGLFALTRPDRRPR
ncbi:MAG: branched-chain amino acid ABC transporter permease [Rhodospirillales bacterium]|nr:branched-chain amino acid ABC transporter permease [Rhodospirillales bacterium]